MSKREEDIEMTAMLIVDDDPDVMEIMRLLLESADYTVFGARNGQDAINQLRNNPQIWGALVDLNMPHMTGGETVEQLLALKPDLNIWVVTGFNSNRNLPPQVRGKVIDVVPKPFDFDTLLAMLDAHKRSE